MCFRRQGSDTENEALLERIQQSGELFVSNAVIRGRYVLPVDADNLLLVLGEYIWDAVSDIQPSQYGPELARRMTLIPADKFKAAQPSGAKA